MKLFFFMEINGFVENVLNMKTLLFNRFNTNTSFLEDICYNHSLKGASCNCKKKALGRVKELARFFENFKNRSIISNKTIINFIGVNVREKIKFFEELKYK